MANPAIHILFPPADYLAWEAKEAQRHEYWDGEVFAMAGAEDRHITVCLNAAMALRQHLQGTPCRTYMADMKVQVDLRAEWTQIFNEGWRQMDALHSRGARLRSGT